LPIHAVDVFFWPIVALLGGLVFCQRYLAKRRRSNAELVRHLADQTELTD